MILFQCLNKPVGSTLRQKNKSVAQRCSGIICSHVTSKLVMPEHDLLELIKVPEEVENLHWLRRESQSFHLF